MVFGAGETLDDLFRRETDLLRVEQGLERAGAEEPEWQCSIEF